MKDKCYFCKGNMVGKKVIFNYWWKKKLTLIENVPAWVCNQCGEEVFEGPVVEAMERLVKERGRMKTISVPIKRFEESLVAQTS